MPTTSWIRGLAATVVLLVSSATALGALNMIGVQSHNEGMAVVPAPGAVAIDGDLADWDWNEHANFGCRGVACDDRSVDPGGAAESRSSQAKPLRRKQAPDFNHSV